MLCPPRGQRRSKHMGAGEPQLPGKAGVAARPWAARARGRNQAAVASLVSIKMRGVPAVVN